MFYQIIRSVHLSELCFTWKRPSFNLIYVFPHLQRIWTTSESNRRNRDAISIFDIELKHNHDAPEINRFTPNIGLIP